MTDISWINEQIAVSGAITDADILCFKSKGIDAIIDVRSEHGDNGELIRANGMQFLHVPVDDRYAPTFEQLEQIFGFIEPLLDEGRKVLIHCQNGCGRSPLVVAAVLAKRGMGISDAVRLIERKHPKVGFTSCQEKFIYAELAEWLKL